ncbi:MAG: hypothetical protein PHR82_00115 [Endomicrobiaceae bacterium]|nr:hypothetical protein [Endomicrobiaceae bacterium]
MIKKFLSVIVTVTLFIGTLPSNGFSAAISPSSGLDAFGKITSANFYNSDTIVINIQDLHNNREVQENTYKLLTNLNKKYKDIEVYLEGASKDVNMNEFVGNMDKNSADTIMDALYNGTQISGTEYFGYKNNKILKPTEESGIYSENIANFTNLINNKKNIQNLLKIKETNIKNVSDRYLNEQQRRILRIYKKYRNKQIDINKFYDRLSTEIKKSKIGINKYINFVLYMEVLKQNKKIDQIKAQRQLQQLLSVLKGTVSFQEYTDLLQLSDNFTDLNIVFSYIGSKVSEIDRYQKYPDLFKLIDLIEQIDLVDPLDLVLEEGEIINDLLLSNCKYRVQKDIVFLNNFITIYRNFVLANVSFNEYNTYKNNINLFYKLYYKYIPNDDFASLMPYAETAEKFNLLNIKRNELFVKNILPEIDRTSQKFNKTAGKYSNIDMTLKSLPTAKKIKVVVTGGFHTSGVNKILAQNKVSYLTITPNIKNKDNNYEKLYFNNILAQANTGRSAIAAMPISEQYPLPLAKDLAEIIYTLRQSGKSWQDISGMFNDIIEERKLKDNIKFTYDAKKEQALFEIAVKDGKPRKIEYENGNINVNGDAISQSTALGSHLKLLIIQALKAGTVASKIREYPQIADNDYLDSAIALLDSQGILLPSVKDAVIRFLFLFETDNSDFEYENIVKDILAKKGMPDFNIVVGKSPYLIGKKDDTYGHSTEYGCLAYIDYSQKTLFLSSDLIDYFRNNYIKGKSVRETEKITKDFFQTLVIHETLERSALAGEYLSFNEYLAKRKLPYSTASFHRFLNSKYIEGLMADRGYSASEINNQRKLLVDLENTIQDVNYGRSEYGDVISIVQASPKYNSDIKSDWLEIRSGNMEKISRYSKILADSIFEQITSQPIYHGYYVIAYRKSSTQKYMREIVKNVEHELNLKKSGIKIKTVEIEEDFNVSNGVERFSVKDEADVKDKKIFFIDDIISKQSDTFHDIYLYFRNNDSVVQSCVFFDLSQEDLNNTLSDQIYEDILNEPSEFIASLKQFNPQITKYPLYWLVRMLNDKEVSSKQFNNFINSLNKNIKRKIIIASAELLNTANKIRGVNSGDLVYLIACLAAGKKLDLNEVGDVLTEYFNDESNSDVAAVLGFDKADDKIAEIDYYDWQDKIALAIPYAKIKGYTILNVSHLGYMTDLQRETVALYAQKYKIVFEDEKRKLKRKRFAPYISQVLKGEITDVQKQLFDAQQEFKNKNTTSIVYARKVKEIMNKAVEISLKIVKDDYNIQIDRNLFDIIVGGSLGKGNMMFDSDVYYDIVTPNEDMSILIDEKFAPVYSFVLSSIGLDTYDVTKYSSSFDNKQNMSTIPDERGIAVFLDYEPLYDEVLPEGIVQKDEYKILNLKLIKKYLRSLLQQALENKEQTLKLIRSMTKNYYTVSVNGCGWIGNSFVQSHDETTDKSFNTRYTILALESKLKEIIFEYMSGLDKKDVYGINIPNGVANQIEFIRKNIKTIPDETLDNIFSAWKSLSQIRFDKTKDTWTGFYNGLDKYGLKNETEARKIINDFINIDITETPGEQKHKFDSQNFLQIVETFIYANTGDVATFKTAYRKYRHVENLLVNIREDEDNTEVANIAKAIVLLSDLDDATLLKFYDFPKSSGNGNTEKIREYIEIIKRSIEIIKTIEDLPKYPQLNGIRTLQNYWDNIIQTSENPQTLLALFAYMLEKTKDIKDDDKKREEYLETMYNVYLPSIYRILGSGAYEYARNNLFISNNPLEYLNILKLIKKIYGANIMQLTELKDIQIVDDLKSFLSEKGFNLNHITIKSRVKTPYSIFEKMTSGRRYGASKDLFGKYFNTDDTDIKSEFLKEIKDVLGLHIIIDGADVNSDDLSNALSEFIAFKTSKKVELSDNKRDLERIKYNFTVVYSKGKTGVPVEACIYSRKAYEDETFGRYDPKKDDVKEPHFIYKLGGTIKERYFGGVFFKDIKHKNFVITTDDEDISEDFCGNFNKIKNKIQVNKNVTCFVEYWNEVYVVDVPENSILMDVLFQPYFTNEKTLVVYNSEGYLLNNGISVVPNGYYKIAVGEDGEEYEYDKNAVPKTVRARLYAEIANKTNIYVREYEKIKSVIGIQATIDKLNDEGLDQNLFLNVISDTQLFDGMLKAGEVYNKIIMNSQFAVIEEILKAFSSLDLSVEDIGRITKLNKIIEKLKTNKEFLTHEEKKFLDKTISISMQKLNKDNLKKADSNYAYLKVLYFLEDKHAEMSVLAERIEMIKKGYLDIGSVSVSDFFTNSILIANHFNLLDVGELWQSFILGIINRHTIIKHPDGREIELANYYDPNYHNKIMPLISLGKNVEQLLKYVMGTPILKEYSGLMMQVLLSLYNQGAYDIGDLLSVESPFLLQTEVDDMKDTIKNRLGISKVDIKVSPSEDLFISKDVYSFATLNVEGDTATLYVSEMFLQKLENSNDEYRGRILSLLVRHELDEYNFLKNNPQSDYQKFHEQSDQKELLDFAQEIAQQLEESKMQTNTDNIIGFNATVFGTMPENTEPASYLNNVLMQFATIMPGILTGDLNVGMDDKKGIDAIPSEILKSVLFVVQNLTDNENIRQQMFKIFNDIKIKDMQQGKQDSVFASKERLLAEIAKTGLSKTKYRLTEQYINWIYESDTIMPETDINLSTSIISELEKDVENTRKILVAA